MGKVHKSMLRRVELSALDRQVLMNLLPNKGDYSAGRIASCLRETLKLTDHEKEVTHLDIPEGVGPQEVARYKASLDEEKAVKCVKAFRLSTKAQTLIVNTLTELKTKKELPTVAHVLYGVMIPEEAETDEVICVADEETSDGPKTGD